MGTSVQKIAAFLDHKGWQYRLDEDNQRIYTGVKGESIEHLLVVVELEEEGEFFSIYAPQVLSDVQNHPHKAAILQAMLSISWETKMLQWEYDPSDGEIRAIIEFPLEDAELTERQFNRCLHGLVQLVDEMAIPRLAHVMATGFDLDEEDEGERLLLALQTEAPGLLTVLERAMEARKRRGKRYLIEPE